MGQQKTRTFILAASDAKIEVIESDQFLPDDGPLHEQISQVAWEPEDHGSDGISNVILTGIFNEKTEKWEFAGVATHYSCVG